MIPSVISCACLQTRLDSNCYGTWLASTFFLWEMTRIATVQIYLFSKIIGRATSRRPSLECNQRWPSRAIPANMSWSAFLALPRLFASATSRAFSVMTFSTASEKCKHVIVKYAILQNIEITYQCLPWLTHYRVNYGWCSLLLGHTIGCPMVSLAGKAPLPHLRSWPEKSGHISGHFHFVARIHNKFKFRHWDCHLMSKVHL